jgi:leader peptidase (prepilin peptidase)/N-methyltransferase
VRWSAVAVAAAVGALAGVLLPLVVYRLAVPWRADGPPHPTRDRCGHCDHALGWLRPGRRCPACGAALGPPTWLLVGLSAAGAAGLGWRLGLTAALVPYLFGFVLGLVLGTVDRLAQRLPHRLVYPGIAVTLVLFAATALVQDQFPAFGRAAAAGVVMFGVYLLLALLPGAVIGGGDLGLAALLGLYLGWMGWPALVFGAALPWLLQGGAAVVMLLRRRADATTMLAFGPAMLAGAYLVLVAMPPK